MGTKITGYSSYCCFFLLVLSLLSYHQSFTQACDANTPTFTLDLTGNPDSVWISPNTVRRGVCCGLPSGPPDNYRCVEFYFTLDPDAEGIRFDIASGAVPPGALGYQINCGPINQVGENICLSGPGPHRLTFCKPGSNANTYSITSIGRPRVSDPIYVSDGCTGTLTATGYQPATITWTSVEPGAVGAYNHYLSCTSGCTTTVVTAQAGYPPYVDYEVSGIPLGGCSGMPVVNLVRVHFVTDKSATILPQDPVICFGGTTATVTAHGTGGLPPYNYTWNTGETTQSINVGIGTYSVVITDQTNCPPAYASVTVTANPSPVMANAGPDVTSCANNPTAVFNGSVTMASGGIWTGGNGTYSTSNTDLNLSYTPTTQEINNGLVTLTLTTTGTGGCPPEQDQAVLTIVPSPVVNAGNDQTVCGNNAAVNLNGSVQNAGGGTWSGGTGTFYPNENSLNVIYTPSQEEIDAGTVTLTLTSTANGTCIPVTDQMTITITPAPLADAGADQTICADADTVYLTGAVLHAGGSVWTSSGSGTFYPDEFELAPQYIPSSDDKEAGVVNLRLTVTDVGTCVPVFDVLTLTITPAPIVVAGNNQTVCADVGAVSLDGNIVVAEGGEWISSGTGYFTPDAFWLNAEYVPSQDDIDAGTVTLVLTSTGNGNCLTYRDTLEITITPAPTITAIPEDLCNGLDGVPLGGTVTIATGGIWSSSGSGVFSPNEYFLDVIYYPSSEDIDAGFATFTLTSDGNGTCQPVADMITVIIKPLPVADAGEDQTICRGASVQLNAQVIEDEVIYEWFTVDGAQISVTYDVTVTAHSDTAFVLSATDYIGCSVYDTVHINVIDPPVMNLASHFCFDYGMTVDADPSGIPPVDGIFQWYRNDTLLLNENTTMLEIYQTGIYMIGYAYENCAVYDTTQITPRPILESVDKIICQNASTVISTSEISGVTYQWSDNGVPVGNNSASYDVNNLGADREFVVTATDQLGCDSRDTVGVTVIPTPELAVANMPSCLGETVTLNAQPLNLPVNGQATFTWSQGGVLMDHTEAVLTVNQDGLYTVVYTLGECEATGSSLVQFHPLPETNPVRSAKFCKETDYSKDLDAGPGTSYLWLESGNTGRTETVFNTGIYHVRIYNQYNCSKVDSVELREACRPRVFLPNAIVIGGNTGENAVDIYGAYFKAFKLTVFNRWGEIIFHSEDKNHIWDGYYRGEPMPIGVYPYILYYEGIEEEFRGPYQEQGSITVIE